jgi:DNA-binding MarR family transcriptional regulator
MTRSRDSRSPRQPLPEVSPLEVHIGYWLRFVSNHVSHAFRGKVEAQGVTVAEWVVLRELYRLGPTAPSVLGDAMGMTRGAVSRLLDRVRNKKLITRKTSSQDRRWQVVALTPAGGDLVPGLAALADENDARFFRDLSSGDRQTLLRILKDLVRIHQLKNVPVD